MLTLPTQQSAKFKGLTLRLPKLRPWSLRFFLKLPSGSPWGLLAVLTVLFSLPGIAFSAEFKDIVVFFVDEIVNPVVVFIVGLATVYFLWGSAKYILHSDDAKAREEGRNMMIHGIVAIFVMVSIWGFVNLLGETFFGPGRFNSTIPKAEDFLPS